MWLKNIIKLAGLALAVGVVCFLHQADATKVSFAGQQGKPSATTQPGPISDIYRGIAVQVNYTADGIDKFLQQIKEVAALGANTVTLSTAGYQEHANSSSITLELRKCPTKKQFARMISLAHGLGMPVVIMPVILLSNPNGTEWRGVIEPADWDRWFASYLGFIKYFAEVGLDNDVEALAVGAELVSTEPFRERWLKVIAEVRRTYHGKLLYSANWDHYEEVTFWDKLDIIGMTTYHKLAEEENPSLETLVENWKPIKAQILKWQATIGKPIVFTEVGWCSQPGASIEAWNYYRHESPSKAGLEEQKRCYQAFIKTWENEPAVAGALWWEWMSGECGPEDYGYCPKGKPAEKVLREWFKAGKRHF